MTEYRPFDQNDPDSSPLSAFRHWLEERERAESTIQRYCNIMQQFFAAYDHVSRNTGIEWKKELRKRDLQPSTINTYVNAFNAYCTMIQDPDSRLKTDRVQHIHTINNIISMDQYQRLLAGLRQDCEWQWYFAVKLLATTGARVHEAIRLRKKDLYNGYVELWTKGKFRTILLPNVHILADPCCVRFLDTLADGSFLLHNRYGLEISCRAVALQLQKFALKYGIPVKVVYPHSFRHFYAVQYLGAGGDIAELADLMGHSNITTTTVYTRLTREEQAQHINKIVKW